MAWLSNETFIENMKKEKSSGHDESSNEVIKSSSPLSGLHSVDVFKDYFHRKRLPRWLRFAEEVPLLESGGENRPENNGPSRLLGSLCKIYAKLIWILMLKFSLKIDIPTPKQSGFRSKKSRNVAVANIEYSCAENWITKKWDLLVWLSGMKLSIH